MDNSIYLATTYLKLLRSDNELTTVLDRAFDGRLEEILQDEFIYGDAISTIFQTFSDQGFDSWLLRFGQHLSVGNHGPLGFAILSSPDLHSAIETLAEFTQIRTSAYRCKSVHRRNRVSFVAEDQTKHPLISQWFAEASIRVAQKLIEAVMAHPLGDIARISFCHPKPAYHQDLQKFFGIPIEYNAQVTALSIPASWCRIASPLSDPDTFKTNLQKCREIKLRLSEEKDLIEATKFDLNAYFSARINEQTTAYGMPTLEHLATKHNCSARTFARRLGEKNQSYKRLLEACRREHAIDLLTHTHISIADISLQLNYQEPANFVRAFKTWFNMPPATWRRQLNKPTKRATRKDNNDRYI